MTRKERFTWMAEWCARNGLALQLEGEVGFGRECVGVLANDQYPDYHWYDDETYDRLDNNGEVWTPEDAYHKHPCVAVLGRGESAEEQLYRWLKWFEGEGFKVETGDVPLSRLKHPIQVFMGQHKYSRLVREVPVPQLVEKASD